MKLLNVELVLKREEDIQHAEVAYDVIKEIGDETTKYAILSHRWEDDSEVTYEEMIGLMKMERQKRVEVGNRSGYQKIIKTCKQAKKDDYEWLWIDTCCIDKRSSAELSEAINSMYRWYQHARVCYAYLSDVGESTFPTERNVETYDKSDGWPEWFMRGWTLQELIAPNQIEFFNRNWVPIGNKQQLAPVLEDVTGIPCDVLRDGMAGKRLSVAQIMSWAADRRTTRVEDRAYSLMGLFEVNMPMVYGEGKKAFRRLQLEIIREFDDHSIFAWDPGMIRAGSFLAEDPSDFRCCSHIRKVEPDEFGDKLVEHIELNNVGNPWFIQHNSWEISTNPIHHCRLAWLKGRARALSQQLRTFTVSNTGIQVCLPVIPLTDSPSHFMAILACTGRGRLVTIGIVYSGSSFARMPGGLFGSPVTLRAYPTFTTLHLAHNQDVNEKRREFTLDDVHASYHKFRRCGTYPHEFTRNTVTLSSLTDGLVVVVYANKDAGSYFAVGLGYYLGQGWVHVICDERQEVHSWQSFGESVHYHMWHARAEHARNMSKLQRTHLTRNTHFVKHAHLSRSIWAAKVVWGRWELNNFRVMVDVEQCPGCCANGQWGTTTTLNDWGGLDMPGLMNTACRTYSLKLDGWLAEVNRCSGQRNSLGDYGDYVDGIVKRTGNIFEDMRSLGIDPELPAYCPLVSRVSSDTRSKYYNTDQAGVTIPYHITGDARPALRQGRGISLPANEHFMLLLKAFSTRLAGKHLVTTIVQCSDFYSVDEEGNRMDSGDDLAPDSGMHDAERILTPFCAIASPQVWRREPPCVRRREQFERIREHFYALVNIRQPTGFELGRKFASRQKKARAVKFFSDVFSLKYLRNYIGEITFFARLPWMAEMDPSSNVLSVCTAEADGLLAHPSTWSCADWVTRCAPLRDNQQSNAARLDARHEVVLPLLRMRLRNFGGLRRSAEKQRVECELKSISQTLGVGLLDPLCDTFCNLYEHAAGTGYRIPVHIDYDRQLNIPSVVQEIAALQAKLDTIEDEDEQRALEEDVTGKILWLCWCGICTEADELLPKVVDYIRREANVEYGLVKTYHVMLSVIVDCRSPMDPGNDQAHLRRIMRDARANTSKHQLLLAARAAEQAKWSGANEGTLAVDNQGTAPSTSTQAPSLSVV